jgi:hypothetical protein
MTVRVERLPNGLALWIEHGWLQRYEHASCHGRTTILPSDTNHFPI